MPLFEENLESAASGSNPFLTTLVQMIRLNVNKAASSANEAERMAVHVQQKTSQIYATTARFLKAFGEERHARATEALQSRMNNEDGDGEDGDGEDDDIDDFVQADIEMKAGDQSWKDDEEYASVSDEGFVYGKQLPEPDPSPPEEEIKTEVDDETLKEEVCHEDYNDGSFAAQGITTKTCAMEGTILLVLGISRMDAKTSRTPTSGYMRTSEFL